ncbi:response regulator transcription factor, partial [Streptomyces sp. NPDC004285]
SAVVAASVGTGGGGGAAGGRARGAPPEDPPRARRPPHAGEALLSPAATKGLIATFLAQGAGAETAGAGGGARTERLAALTAREREVLVLVAGGLSNDEIAERLDVSPLTVKTHVNRTMAKLGARDRAQLVVTAYESGLVRPRVE